MFFEDPPRNLGGESPPPNLGGMGFQGRCLVQAIADRHSRTSIVYLVWHMADVSQPPFFVNCHCKASKKYIYFILHERPSCEH